MIHDISPPISAQLAVWPGDTPPSREVLLDMKQGANVTLSTLRATVHLGAHADAFSHFDAESPGIEGRPLDDYLGPCQVIRCRVARGAKIARADFDRPVVAERVLLWTGTFPDPRNFNQDFAALTADLVDHLAAQGVRLVGIDTPSVDPFDSQELPAHHAFRRHEMAILECLRLDDVPEGIYELVALPLRLVGFDASPVRAILRTL